MSSSLTFHPAAWFLYQYLCHRTDTEVGGYGVIRDQKRPLYVHDLIVPRQDCTVISTDLDIDHLSELYEDLLDEGLEPWQYSSVWFHTHPNISAEPSQTDESTFANITKRSQSPWMVMAILSKLQEFTATIQINHPTRQRFRLGLSVDWARIDEVDLQEVLLAGEEALAGVHKVKEVQYPVWVPKKYEYSWEREYRNQVDRQKKREQDEAWSRLDDYESIYLEDGLYD